MLDSLDKYWAGEAKHHLPLNGVRGGLGRSADLLGRSPKLPPLRRRPVAAHSSSLPDAAKFRLPRLAEPLQENLLRLSELLEPRRDQT